MQAKHRNIIELWHMSSLTNQARSAIINSYILTTQIDHKHITVPFLMYIQIFDNI